MLILQVGCRTEPKNLSLHDSDQPVVFFNGYTIPKFPRAIDQLNYARSGFPSNDEKKAAFEFVLRHFPQDRAECGEAILNIAYMNFGFDYRFALIQDYLNALEEYKTITRYYADQPSVMAKAYWYIGWIYCDLLSRKEEGLEYFRKIINEYPDTAFGITSPVPWVTLVYLEEDIKAKPKPKKVTTQWAEIALLEIIRHSRDGVEVSDAFDQLWQKFRNKAATGQAMKLLLQRPAHAEQVKPRVHAFLDQYRANPFLARELQAVLDPSFKEPL